MKQASRECGDCTLCCKLPLIEDKELQKKEYTWCKDCEIGVGCKIYSKRPKVCKDFKCEWLLGHFPEHARPDKVGFYGTTENLHSLTEKVFTLYAVEHKIHQIEKNLSKFRIVDSDGDEWRYCIRYNGNDDDLGVYDRKRFGERVLFGKRGEII